MVQTPIVPHTQPTVMSKPQPFFEAAIERICSVYTQDSARKDGIYYWPEPLPTPDQQQPDPLVLFYPEQSLTTHTGMEQQECEAVIPMTRREVLERRSRDNIRPSMQIPLGLTDKPAEQQRETLLINLHGTGGDETGGPLLIAGAQHSGKATTLQTILFWLTTRFLPEQLHCAILDPFAELTHFQSLPHLYNSNGDACWSTGHADEQLRHFAESVQAEIQQRRTTFSQQHAQTLAQLWSQGMILPQILVVISNYQFFAERTATAMPLKKLVQSVIEARTLGIYLVITSTETNQRYIPQEIINQCSTKIGLNLKDQQRRELFGSTLLSTEAVPGRGWIQTPERRIQEIQLALPINGTNESLRDVELKRELLQPTL
ncbi:hypothetical protein KDA_25110 [Dictyobacter alpinus]|uniref:FtsK domain-containing protein n=1 Tax=Dictyobacter alpinus TaxID=2014873 RepID=A0A402B6S6_9CHLR|nr:FtsK/SpoIIIE domain-containing protein [Dictyobacter alpinus]GCE27027.1 hypothetical protein KDA_25110 [Dictyobacter alpinus]